LFGRPRLAAGRPQGGGGLETDGIGQPDFGDAVTEVGIGAVACVGPYHFGRDPSGADRTKLVQRDLRLGLEDDIIRPAYPGPPIGVIGPFMRQIQATGRLA
jgi:hypothetical protein